MAVSILLSGSSIMTNQNTNSTEYRVDELMSLSLLVGQFLEVSRATIRGSRHETDGEHTVHLQFIAVSYAAKYHPRLDLGKVSLYALVHDFIEVYADDVNSLMASEEVLLAKQVAEEAALNRLKSEFGESWPHLIEMIERYESLNEPEARFVKSLDKCDPSFSHYFDAGQALYKMGVVSADQFSQLTVKTKSSVEMYALEFPDILAIREELIRRIAEVAYPAV